MTFSVLSHTATTDLTLPSIQLVWAYVLGAAILIIRSLRVEESVIPAAVNLSQSRSVLLCIVPTNTSPARSWLCLNVQQGDLFFLFDSRMINKLGFWLQENLKTAENTEKGSFSLWISSTQRAVGRFIWGLSEFAWTLGSQLLKTLNLKICRIYSPSTQDLLTICISLYILPY